MSIHLLYYTNKDCGFPILNKLQKSPPWKRPVFLKPAAIDICASSNKWKFRARSEETCTKDWNTSQKRCGGVVRYSSAQFNVRIFEFKDLQTDQDKSLRVFSCKY